MMEFIVKFRANAKRATMVQSRIKTVEKMDLEAPEPVEIEQVWNFSIPNPEPLGRPVLSIDDVSFDYEVDAERVRIERARIEGEGVEVKEGDGKRTTTTTIKKPLGEYLLRDVNFGIDLSSRIGILGPNGEDDVERRGGERKGRREKDGKKTRPFSPPLLYCCAYITMYALS